MIVRFLFYYFLLNTFVFASENLSSKYVSKGHKFEIKASLSWVTSNQYKHSTILIQYSVFKDGKFVHPETVSGGTIVGRASGRWKNIAEEVSVELIEEIGWIVNVGAIRGNTSSDYYTIICPTPTYSGEWIYKHCTFIAKEKPIIREVDDRLEIWSFYQDWEEQAQLVVFMFLS